MNFTERMEAMEEELQDLCKRGVGAMVRERVEGRSSGPMLQDLLLQSTMFQEAYKTAFEHNFEGFATAETARALLIAADHLGYSLSVLLRINPTYSLDKLLVFLESMLSVQLAHFETWCDGVAVAVAEAGYS